MSITDNQKRLYNLHLASYKNHQNKPYTKRQNFDTFLIDDPNNYVQLLKLENFFNHNTQVNIKLFFEAPYNLYEDKDFFSLNYYTSQAAIKAYNLYLKQLSEASPDSPSQLNFIKDSLGFVQKYCCNHKIEVIKYLTYREMLPLSWAVHIAEHKTSIYMILGFEYFNISIYDSMFDMPEDEQELLLGDIVKQYTIYKEKLEQSKLAKKLVIEGIKIIDKNVKEDLKTKIDNGNILVVNKT